MSKMQILLSYFQAKKRLKWDRKRLEIWHKKEIRKMILYAKKHSPFYRELYRNKKEFLSLPIISKKEIMEAFDLFNTVGISKDKAIQTALEGERNKTYDSAIDKITVGLSSGTSGKRGVFLASEKEAALWCGNILAKTLTRSIFKKEKVALFLRANSRLYKTASSIKYFSLDGDYEKVKDFNPDILVAPPSLLRKLPKIKPKKIISVAEVLEPLDQKFLEKKFGRQIDQVYQCTEGFLGFTCENGSLHLNEDVLHIEKEYVDRSTGRFLPIITDLFRSTQPIIRYRLDDVLIEGACNCGLSFMAVECVEGRLMDVLSFKKEGGEQAVVFPREIGKIFSSNYRLKQDSQNVLHLYGGSEKVLRDFLHRKKIIPPRIVCYSELPKRNDYEKLRRVQRDGSSIFN